MSTETEEREGEDFIPENVAKKGTGPTGDGPGSLVYPGPGLANAFCLCHSLPSRPSRPDSPAKLKVASVLSRRQKERQSGPL